MQVTSPHDPHPSPLLRVYVCNACIHMHLHPYTGTYPVNRTEALEGGRKYINLIDPLSIALAISASKLIRKLPRYGVQIPPDWGPCSWVCMYLGARRYIL